MSNYKDFRLTIAPMMDWTDWQRKVNKNQGLKLTTNPVLYQMQYHAVEYLVFCPECARGVTCTQSLHDLCFERRVRPAVRGFGSLGSQGLLPSRQGDDDPRHR
jgi:hypothetical protein